MDAPARQDFTETAVDTPVGSLQPVILHRFRLSPLNRRRWESFKANRRGYWSLWIFLAMFLISLFAEFIANDKPVYIHVNGKTFFPAVMTYPDTAFAKTARPQFVRHRRRLSRRLFDGIDSERGRHHRLAAGALLL